MSADLLYSIVNTVVLPVWVALALAPGRVWAQRLAFGVAVPLLSLTYAALLVFALSRGGMGESPDFGTLEGMMSALSDPYGFVAAWTHYLAFDLFVGAWIARDAVALGLKRWQIALPLFFTLMAGPFGLLFYLTIRQAKRRRLIAEPLPFAAMKAPSS